MIRCPLDVQRLSGKELGKMALSPKATTLYKILQQNLKTNVSSSRRSHLFIQPHAVLCIHMIKIQRGCLRTGFRLKIAKKSEILVAPLSFYNSKILINSYKTSIKICIFFDSFSWIVCILQHEASEVRLSPLCVFESCPATHDSDFGFDVERKTHGEGGWKDKISH